MQWYRMSVGELDGRVVRVRREEKNRGEALFLRYRKLRLTDRLPDGHRKRVARRIWAQRGCTMVLTPLSSLKKALLLSVSCLRTESESVILLTCVSTTIRPAKHLRICAIFCIAPKQDGEGAVGCQIDASQLFKLTVRALCWDVDFKLVMFLKKVLVPTVDHGRRWASRFARPPIKTSYEGFFDNTDRRECWCQSRYTNSVSKRHL